MSSNLVVKQIWVAIILSLAGEVQGALAAGDTVPQPPPVRTIDDNSVDLLSGNAVMDMPVISSAGIQRVGDSMRVLFKDNFSGYVPSGDNPWGIPGDTSAIYVEGRRAVKGVDVYHLQTGANPYDSWIAKDGTQYLFDTSKSSEGYRSHEARSSTLTQIVKPDGEVITITFAEINSTFEPELVATNTYIYHNIMQYQPRSVESSLGWMVKYEFTLSSSPDNSVNTYIPNKIYIINRALDYCEPEAASCTSINDAVRPTLKTTWSTNCCEYYDGDDNDLGYFSNSVTATPSGNGTFFEYDAASTPTQPTATRRILKAHRFGRETVYSYNWQPYNLGTPPYIVTATKPDGTSYSIVSDKAYFQLNPPTVEEAQDLWGNVFLVYSQDMTPKWYYLNQITSFTDELGRITKYEYNDDNTAFHADNRTIKRVISPEATYSSGTLTGGYTEYAYDARRNITSVSVVPKNGGAPLTTTYEYEETCTVANYKYCNKPRKVTDPKTGVTNFTYSPDHGGIVTETGPADVSNVRPQTRYSYAALYAKSVNSAGTPVPNATPVWRLVQTSSCRSATTANPASCVGTDQETLTDFEYATNNLLKTKETIRVPGANLLQPSSPTNLWRSTSYTYDYVGNIVSVDGPRTDIDDRTYTVYDHRRRPVYDIGIDPDGAGPLPSVAIHHVYDIDGREYRTETGTGIAANLRNCSITALTCSAFSVTNYTQRTYEDITGLEVKSIVAVP